MIEALVLAGGAGRRVQGRDKGLVDWHGRPLIEHVIGRVRPQVRTLHISCNRNRSVYANYAPLTPPDRRGNYQGPLAGLEAAQQSLQQAYVLLVPCDTPLLPDCLGARLLATLQQQPHSQVTYAVTAEADHYLCALLRRKALASLTPYLDSGARSVHGWYQELGGIATDFEDQGDNFINLNSLP